MHTPELDHFMNFAITLDLYASLQMELGNELVFPENASQYKNIIDHCTAENAGAFQIFVSTDNSIPCGAYNITNGDRPRFSELWPKLAE